MRYVSYNINIELPEKKKKKALLQCLNLSYCRYDQILIFNKQHQLFNIQVPITNFISYSFRLDSYSLSGEPNPLIPTIDHDLRYYGCPTSYDNTA